MASNETYIFAFEKQWDYHFFYDYMREHWADSIIYSAVYLIAIFGGQFYMQKRKRFDLRPALALWSGLLAIFSIAGTYRLLPELIHSVRDHSLEYSMCVTSFLEDPVPSFWTFLFTVSKVIELGDTVFIVLRKQELIFLHWYHHITVLIYVWFSYPDKIASGRWYMTMNFLVHSIMYTYYAFRAMKFNIPKQVNIFITTLQLLQMVIGSSIAIFTYNLLNSGKFCQQTYGNIRFCFIMYSSYFVLFAHFFYTTYIVEKPKMGHRKQQ
ncbi:hypothetical protein CHS0354_028355 [Potamilus streckersoni]|uniref:Elongation of very long chain fatty acids protein n=1 Tax=Potamilus streckersoni TaxID=2493646 RepID=A0AAE0VIX4_9BIVA|nr:hypothetical protein CHS0354_028355 [Potamilus streckersoni]